MPTWPIAHLATDPDDIVRIHHELLIPAFPSDAPADVEDLLDAITLGVMSIYAIHADDGTPLAFALGDHYPSARTVLLAYLAVRSDFRNQGLGSLVYRTALDGWAAAHGPCMILAEVENASCEPDPQGGDPVARLRFYDRHGARHLAGVPYFQPAMYGSDERPDLLLLACHVDAALHGPEGSGSVRSTDLVTFLKENIEVCEGAPVSDWQARALIRAAQTRQGRTLQPLLGGADTLAA